MANKLQKGMQDFGIKQALKYLEKTRKKIFQS